MNNPIRHIYSKEMRDILRDKRVRANAFVAPFVMVVIMIVGFGRLEDVLTKPENFKVAIVEAKAPNPVYTGLMNSKALKVTLVKSETEGRRLLQEGKARIVLVFEDRFLDQLARGEKATIRAYYDPGQEMSRASYRAIRTAIDQANRSNARRLLTENGISEGQAEPYRLESLGTTGRSGTSSGPGPSSLIVMILPYIMVIFAFLGGMTMATDLVAGEKEKNTLETLLITPVGRTHIAVGKFLALATVCFASSMSSLAGLLIASSLPFAKGELGTRALTISEVTASILVLIPLVAFLAGILLAVSAFARNSRECQSYLAVVNIIVIVPAILSQFLGFTGFERSWWVNLVPVLNSAANIRAVLTGKMEWVSVVMTSAVGLLLAAVGLLAVVAMFKREQILTRV